MNAPTRPVLRWHGGKWKLYPWIIGFFPQHRIYVEPFGGGGSMLIRKPRTYAEVYNDLDDVVVNLFRVLRDEAKAKRLVEQLRLTPFARAEFVDALNAAEDDVERARHLIVRSFMGFGSNAHSASPVADKNGFKTYARPQDQADAYRSTGFRANSNRSGTTPAHDWANYPDALELIVERLGGVIVENRPAIDVMKQHDGGGHATLRRSALHARHPLAGEQIRSQASHVPARAYAGRSPRIADVPEDAGGHGVALRLSASALRRVAAGLAARGMRRTCRRRTPAHRSSLDQSCRCGSSRPRTIRAEATRCIRRRAVRSLKAFQNAQPGQRKNLSRASASTPPVLTRHVAHHRQKRVIGRRPIQQIDGGLVLRQRRIDVLHLVQNLSEVFVIFVSIGLHVGQILEAKTAFESARQRRKVLNAFKFENELTRNDPAAEIATKERASRGVILILADQPTPITRFDNAAWSHASHRQVVQRQFSLPQKRAA